jgi:hypothetical protein
MALKIRGFAPDDASGIQPKAVQSLPTKPVKERTTAVAPSRVGLEQFVFYVSPEAKRQIRGWVGLNGTTMQEIGQEMLDDWCRKKGLHRLG